MRNIIEALKDPKKRSLAMFGIYFIFFIFVFVVLNIADSKPVIDTSSTNPNANTNNLSAIENYKDIFERNKNVPILFAKEVLYFKEFRV